jgi:Holliday junction DNA helicase RuvB
MVVTSAPALEKPKDLAGLLTSLNEGSLFFIDEIHRLKPALEEMLYIAMEDFELDFIIGAGAGARSVRIPVPRFTLAGATTKPGRVSAPLYTRFGITLRIDFYPPEELKMIILRTSKLLNMPISNEAATLLAQCSRGTPRVSNRLLRRMRDFAEVAGKKIIDLETVDEALKRLYIDSEGLERQDRTILSTIINNYQGGPVGLDTLAIAVGESADSLEDFYEPYLVQKGFLQRTPRGRKVTTKAYGHLGLNAPQEGNQLFTE